jgi:DNA polymerase III subunit delta'
MNAIVNFQTFVGNGRVVKILRRAMDQQRLPHALIFAGPVGVGKCTLARILAKQLNCLQPVHGDACEACRSCRKIDQSSHPDVRTIEPDGAFIKIAQIRELIDEIAYQPFEGRFRVAILDGADQMAKGAANCLLKTLEEPPSRSILILVTAKPYSLLSTIRSRSRLIQFGSIAEDRIAEYLMNRAGQAPEDARLAAALSNGSLGAALEFDAAHGRELREQALRFVSLLLRKERFAQATVLAASIGKDKESFQPWVEMTATLLQDVYYAQMAPERMSQRDLAGELTGLAQAASHAAVVSGIEAIKDLRSALQRNVNRQLALEALFLSQTAGC